MRNKAFDRAEIDFRENSARPVSIIEVYPGDRPEAADKSRILQPEAMRACLTRPPTAAVEPAPHLDAQLSRSSPILFRISIILHYFK